VDERLTQIVAKISSLPPALRENFIAILERQVDVVVQAQKGGACVAQSRRL